MTESNDNLISYLAVFGILSEAVQTKKRHIKIDIPIPPEFAQNFEDVRAVCRTHGLEVQTEN